jgi:hypothetical protein
MRLAPPLVVVLLAGCSLTTMQRAPARPWQQRPVCTSDRSAVKQDFLVAGGAAVVGLVLVVIGAAMEDEDDGEVAGLEKEGMNGVMLAGAITLVGGTLVFGGSGGYGFNQTQQCREAQAAFDRGER